jgi:pantetheine-phosphate adenylyltransferase
MNTKKIAIYPGSFDPVTRGHIEIVAKAASVFDEVYVVVCVNAQKPASTFTVEERVEMLRLATQRFPNVLVDKHFGMAVEYATQRGAKVMIRGVRNPRDFENEITQYHFNHYINSSIETMILFPNVESLYVSSSSIKELASFSHDFYDFVPPEIYDYLKVRLLPKK